MRRFKIEIQRSWPSLVAAIFATTGYVLVGQKNPLGWLATATGNFFLMFIGLKTKQWGLMISALFMVIAVINFINWLH